MTEAQAAWLRKLRDEGPQKADFSYDSPLSCVADGWAKIVIGNRGFYAAITPAGLAALASHDEAAALAAMQPHERQNFQRVMGQRARLVPDENGLVSIKKGE